MEDRRLLAAAPTGLVATGISTSAIALTWNASPEIGVTGYDVFSRAFVSNGGGKGSHGGHYVYKLLASNLKTRADVVDGFLPGTFHTFLVTAIDAAGMSAYSAPVTAETWIAPSLSYGSAIELSSGAVYTSPIAVPAGQTVQITLLASGNPLSYAVISGPKTLSVDSKSGVVTYTPAKNEAGTVTAKFKIFNSVGSVIQTVHFQVSAPNPKLLTPKVKLAGTTLTYTGGYLGVTATALASNGTTQVPGSFTFAYNGGPGLPQNAGKYTVLAMFASADPKYSGATALGTLTILKATPAFSNLISPTIAIGTASTVVSGQIAAGTAYPAGESVLVTLHGVTQSATIDQYGGFSTNFATNTLPLGASKITYAFAGSKNFNIAATVSSTITVIPTAVPRITLSPKNVITTAGDPATFTATANGSPPPLVQWQVSTDGGLTFTDIGSISGTSTTLSFASTAAENGFKYRAVFSNGVGTVITPVVTLTVETDTGGGT